MRLRALVSLQMLVQRAFVAHWFLANGAYVLQAVVWPSLVYLLVALKAVIRCEGGATRITFEFLETAVKLDVILQRKNRLHFLTTQMAYVVTFVCMHGVAMGQLFRPRHEMLFTVLAAIR